MKRDPIDNLANMPDELLPGMALVEQAVVRAIKKLKHSEKEIINV